MRRLRILVAAALFIVALLVAFAPGRAGAFVCMEDTGNCCDSALARKLNMSC